MTAEPAVIARVRKFPCESCGADLRWDPGVTALQCGYCGASRNIAPSAEEIRERPVDALLRAPRNLGWGAERKAVVCRRCGAHTTLDPHVAASSCPFCGTAGVVEAPPDGSVARPEGLLPFQVPRSAAIESFRDWLGSLWLRPNDLKSAARATSIQGAYIPFWTFDAATQSSWTAEAGHYYYVNVTVRQNGRRVNRRERRIRWEPASGVLGRFFDDVPVPASRGLDASLCRGIEPFPTAELTPYDPAYLAGFLAEENAVDLPEALESAKERMRGEIRAACARAVPGDTHRHLEVQTIFSALACKNALLPVWVAAYDYRGTPYRFLVNGVTGRCTGNAPWSWAKITALILVLLAVVLAILYAAG